MNALDFLDTAVRLSGSSREADKRSAVSRAYYGVFHLAIKFVEDAGIKLPVSAAVHEKLAWVLGSGSSYEIAKAGSMLESLRKVRNTADYDLDDVSFRDPAKVRMHVSVAQDIVSALAACEAEPIRSQIHANMRAYAKNTLRLIVVDIGEAEA